MEKVDIRLNIAKSCWCSQLDGPGKRIVFWLQGCPFRCKGCNTPQFLRTDAIRTNPKVEDVVKAIQLAKKNYGVEGVTFTGGEPFLQAAPLTVLARVCRLLGLTVTIFTGYLYDDLKSIPENLGLLQQIDLLIDGYFQIDNLEKERNWVGSTNQTFHYLSNKYSPEIERPSIDGYRLFPINKAYDGYYFSVTTKGELVTLDKHRWMKKV